MAREFPLLPGKIVALLGKAVARGPGGDLRLLAVGDWVDAGEEIITAQNSLVELASDAGARPGASAQASRSADPDPSSSESLLLVDPGSASLMPALRVESVSEGVDPAPPSARGPSTDPRSAAGRDAGDRLAPEADSLRLSTLEDNALPITLSGRDADGTLAHFVVVRVPTGGVMSKPGNLPFTDGAMLTPAEAGALLFTPAPDFNGDPGPLQYRVIDTAGRSSGLASVEIQVLAVNDAPLAGSVPLGVDGVAIADPSPNHVPGTSDYRYAAFEDQPLSGRIQATDVDLDPLRFSVAAEARHGSVRVDPDGSFVYHPVAGFVGSDGFAVLVDDGQGGMARATVQVDVGSAPGGPALPAGQDTDHATGSASSAVAIGSGVFAWHLGEPAAGTQDFLVAQGAVEARASTALLDLRDLLPGDQEIDLSALFPATSAADAQAAGLGAEVRLDLGLDWGLLASGIDLLREAAIPIDG